MARSQRKTPHRQFTQRARPRRCDQANYATGQPCQHPLKPSPSRQLCNQPTGALPAKHSMTAWAWHGCGNGGEAAGQATTAIERRETSGVTIVARAGRRQRQRRAGGTQGECAGRRAVGSTGHRGPFTRPCSVGGPATSGELAAGDDTWGVPTAVLRGSTGHRGTFTRPCWVGEPATSGELAAGDDTCGVMTAVLRGSTGRRGPVTDPAGTVERLPVASWQRLGTHGGVGRRLAPRCPDPRLRRGWAQQGRDGLRRR